MLQGDAAVTQAVVFLADRVSEADIRAALDGLVSRNEILRTTFASIAGMRVPTQLIRDDLPAAWSSSVLAGDDSVEPLLDSLLGKEQAALDTEQGPIVRAVLATLPDSRQALVLTAPAACLDGKSMILLLHELGQAAGGLTLPRIRCSTPITPSGVGSSSMSVRPTPRLPARGGNGSGAASPPIALRTVRRRTRRSRRVQIALRAGRSPHPCRRRASASPRRYF